MAAQSGLKYSKERYTVEFTHLLCNPLILSRTRLL